jgi:hypothetical protein
MCSLIALYRNFNFAKSDRTAHRDLEFITDHMDVVFLLVREQPISNHVVSSQEALKFKFLMIFNDLRNFKNSD